MESQQNVVIQIFTYKPSKCLQCKITLILNCLLVIYVNDASKALQKCKWKYLNVWSI